MNGEHNGCHAEMIGINEGKFTASVKLTSVSCYPCAWLGLAFISGRRTISKSMVVNNIEKSYLPLPSLPPPAFVADNVDRLLEHIMYIDRMAVVTALFL